MIEIRNVDKKYGKIYALKNVSFNIKEGKITGIFGINGVGKSTILKAITGLTRIDKGEILIDGEKIHPKIYNKISFVPDVDTYFPNFTIRESFNLLLTSTTQSISTKMNRSLAMHTAKLKKMRKHKRN